MECHEVCDLFPPMEKDDFAALCEDIARRGQIDPITIHQDKIIDGRNRYNACCLLGLAPRFQEWAGEGGSLIEFVVSRNLHRRHLSASQRATLAVELLPMLREAAKERQREAGRKFGRGKNKDSPNGEPSLGDQLCDALMPMLPIRTEAHNRKLAEKRSRHQVYFIRHGDRIKIGHSEWPERRLREIRTSCPDANLIGAMPGSCEQEREIQAKCATYSLGGEWFAATDEVLAIIQSELALVKDDQSYQDGGEEPLHCRERAAQVAGVSTGYITDAEAIKEADPDAYEEVKRGTLSIPAAKKRIREKARTKPEAEPCSHTVMVQATTNDPTNFCKWMRAEIKEGNMSRADVERYIDALGYVLAELS